MTGFEDAMDAVAAAMEEAVPELTEGLPREVDDVDNLVEWPYGEILVTSDVRADPWNTEFVEYATDDDGNRTGEIYEARFDPEVQLNIWIAVPNEEFDIQTLGTKLQTGLHKYDENRRNPQPLPDGDGGTADFIKKFRIIDGGRLPTEDQSPPLRGYRVDASFRYIDRIDTSDEEDEVYVIESVDTPRPGDLEDGERENIAIEYNA